MCNAHLSHEIYPRMKFQLYSSKTFQALDKKYENFQRTITQKIRELFKVELSFLYTALFPNKILRSFHQWSFILISQILFKLYSTGTKLSMKKWCSLVKLYRHVHTNCQRFALCMLCVWVKNRKGTNVGSCVTMYFQ